MYVVNCLICNVCVFCVMKKLRELFHEDVSVRISWREEPTNGDNTDNTNEGRSATPGSGEGGNVTNFVKHISMNNVIKRFKSAEDAGIEIVGEDSNSMAKALSA